MVRFPPPQERKTIIDVTGVHPTPSNIQNNKNKNMVPGFYAAVAEKQKLDWYDKRYVDLSPESKKVIPFAFESSGALADLGKKLLKEVARYHSNHVDQTTSYPVYFRHLTETVSVCIARSNARILLVYADIVSHPHGHRLARRGPVVADDAELEEEPEHELTKIGKRKRKEHGAGEGEGEGRDNGKQGVVPRDENNEQLQVENDENVVTTPTHTSLSLSLSYPSGSSQDM